METERTLEQKNEAQRKTIVELTAALKTMGQTVAELQIWKDFVAYQISNCNMQEEVLQQWMSDMLAAQKKGTKS